MPGLAQELIIGRCIDSNDGRGPALVNAAHYLENGSLRLALAYTDGSTGELVCMPKLLESGGEAVDEEEFLERVPCCPLCQSPDHTASALFSVAQLFWKVDVLRCSVCGMGYKSAKPTSALMRHIYSADYAHFVPDASAADDLASRVKRMGSGLGRHLDFGCGSGSFVLAALRSGWDSYGVDPYAPDLPANHPLQGRLLTHDGDGFPLSVQAGSFDCITLWAVVEHLTDPCRTFRSLSRLLRPGGRLTFNAPNCTSLAAKSMGPSWYMATLLEHVIMWSPETSAWLAAELGLKLVRQRICGSPYPFGTGGCGLSGQGLRSLPFSVSVMARERPCLEPEEGGSRERPFRPASTLRSVLGAMGRLARARKSDSALMNLMRGAIHMSRLGDHVEVTLEKPVGAIVEA